jgi:hypothetical protein
LEAVAAVHGLIPSRIERDFGHAAALAAGRGEHFARTSAATLATASAALIVGPHGLASLAAVGATVGFVLEAFLLVKALFARTKDELTSTVHTVEHFIYVHET